MNSDDDLRDEVEEMFRDEARNYNKAAKPTGKLLPGYYDDKCYSEGEGKVDADIELRRLQRQKNKRNK